LESIKERTEKAVSFVEWLAEVLRGKNWVTKLLLLDVLLLLFFSPPVLSKILGLLPKDLLRIAPELPRWYLPAFWLMTGLVFVAALVVAYRTVPRKVGMRGAPAGRAYRDQVPAPVRFRERGGVHPLAA
jgi:hypothetical protein